MKNNKPKIRFKDFTGPWEQRKLGDVAKYRNGKAHENDISEQGKFIVVNSKFVSTNGEVRKFSNKQIEPLFKNEIAFVLSDVPNGRAIARTFLVDKNDKYTLNQRIAGITPIEDVCPYYLHILMNRNKYFLQFDDGAKQTNLSVTDVMEFAEHYPSGKEQRQIGMFFQQLDHLITLHQRKCDNLKKIKKAMLEKLFPKNGNSIPEVRFKGFTDDWEQRKLRDIVGIYDGVHQTPKYQDGGIMFLSVENIATLHSSKYISEEDFKRDYKVYPQENDILMTRIGDVGTTNVVTDNGLKAYYVSLALLKYRSTNPFFLSNAIQSDYVQNGLSNRTLKTAIPMKINKDEIGKVDVMLPTSTDEQVQIGTYFRNLDNLITLHQRKVENLKKIKKAMLEKMFPKEDLI